MNTVKEMLIDTVIPKIKRKIESQRLKQKEVSQMLGWQQSVVSKFLNMKKKSKSTGEDMTKKFSIDSILYVAEVFEVEVEIFVDGQRLSEINDKDAA